jgi:hypothetical protein
MDIKPPPVLLEQLTDDKDIKKRNKKKAYKQRVKNRRKEQEETKETKETKEMQPTTDDAKARLRNKLDDIRQKRDGTMHRKAEEMKKNMFGNTKNLNPNTVMDKLGITDEDTKKMIVNVMKSGNFQNVQQQLMKVLEKK